MLVDDSIVARSILERILENDGRFAVVASLPNASDALSALSRAAPDIIILDIEMPGMNGLAALPLLIEQAPRARVIILSANCEDDGPAAIEALALGAADTLVKPGRGSFAGRFSETLLARLTALAEKEPAPAPRSAPRRVATVQPLEIARAHRIAAIGIGASTGGIMAINTFLRALPSGMSAPIFITQHLPGTFMPFFAEQLRRIVARPVAVASDGMKVAPGNIYLAPGGGHLCVTRRGDAVTIGISTAPAVSGAMPSVDPMMASMADCYGAGACAVMLSGMGRDGLDGVRLVRSRGGLILAQDVASSVVWGMPGVVVREGLAAHVFAPEELARIIAAVGSADVHHD